MAVIYTPIDLEEAVGKYKRNVHASHIMLWTRDSSSGHQVIYCLMQMRSDGLFGFPGGKSDEDLVDKNEIVSSLYRELAEEIDFRPVNGDITIANRISSHIHIKGKVLHFFAKELPLATFQTIERTHMNARDFPKESVGLIRVPLRVVGHSSYKAMRKFFDYFAKQLFSGNAKSQLINTAIRLNLIGEEDVEYLVNKLKN